MILLVKINIIRQISCEDGKEFAFKNNLLFFETSAKTGENIEKVSYIIFFSCFFKNSERFSMKALKLFIKKLKQDN